jgi:hypothetical protein
MGALARDTFLLAIDEAFAALHADAAFFEELAAAGSPTDVERLLRSRFEDMFAALETRKDEILAHLAQYSVDG